MNLKFVLYGWGKAILAGISILILIPLMRLFGFDPGYYILMYTDGLPGVLQVLPFSLVYIVVPLGAILNQDLEVKRGI